MSAAAPTNPQPPSTIHLRRTLPADIPTLFQIQLDPAGNELAGTAPRGRAAFEARWEEILGAWEQAMHEPSSVGVTPRVIIADGLLVGSINIVREHGRDWLGYWIAREHWGRGIATRAIALMLGEVPTRPLSARVTTHNAASLRALERNGFKVTGRTAVEATDRFAAGERIILTLEESRI